MRTSVIITRARSSPVLGRVRAGRRPLMTIAVGWVMTSDGVASVRYRAASPADHEAIATLVSTVWPERLVDASRVAAWVRGSATSLVAVAGSDIIGFVRVISDNVSSALIAMLV